MTGWRRQRDILISLLLMTALWLPVLGNLFMPQADSTQEKRKLAEMPEIGWQKRVIEKFPAQFEKYYNDHFGFRQQLISWYNKLNLALNLSPSAKVFTGKQGWLFYRDRYTANDYMHVDINDLQIFIKWRDVLEAKQRLCAARKVKYLFVIAPDKHTIYPEYFPSVYKQAGDKSRLDRFLEYMHDNSDVDVLDLRPVLLEGKKTNRIYHVTDTHWNQRGVVIVRDAIFKTLAEKYDMEKLRKLPQVSFRDLDHKGGDLSAILGLSDEIREVWPVSLPSDDHCGTKTTPDLTGLKLRGHYKSHAFTCAAASYRLLMFHDSFGNGLIQHLFGHFRESLFLNINPTKGEFGALLDKFRPDVVIEEKVERSLHSLPVESESFLQ